MTKAYMDITVGSTRLGRLNLVLYEDTVPRTVENFKSLVQQRQKEGYAGSKFHRIIQGFMAQGGDFGGSSIYGSSFADENFLHSHNARGILSMANSGPDTNGTQFFITFRPTPHLNGKHVVFGHVDLSTESAGVLNALENVQTGKNDVPTVPIIISDCGLVSNTEKEDEPAAAEASVTDKDEINVDEVEVEDEGYPHQSLKLAEETSEAVIEEEEEQNDEPKSQNQLLRERMKRLKMKMNQARQLNRSEVLREGERLGSEEGNAKERKRQVMRNKELRQAEKDAQNGRALDVVADVGEEKYLVEQAEDSIRNARQKAEKKEKSRFATNDYYNPEGQHRNYERNLKSLSNSSAATHVDSAASVYNPMMGVVSSSGEKEEDGARRLANEMKRRIEKQASNKRNRQEFGETDVSYINERNKRFNQKISRNFDEHTANIRQDLERGTAL